MLWWALVSVTLFPVCTALFYGISTPASTAWLPDGLPVTGVGQSVTTWNDSSHGYTLTGGGVTFTSLSLPNTNFYGLRGTVSTGDADLFLGALSSWPEFPRPTGPLTGLMLLRWVSGGDHLYPHFYREAALCCAGDAGLFGGIYTLGGGQVRLAIDIIGGNTVSSPITFDTSAWFVYTIRKPAGVASGTVVDMFLNRNLSASLALVRAAQVDGNGYFLTSYNPASSTMDLGAVVYYNTTLSDADVGTVTDYLLSTYASAAAPSTASPTSAPTAVPTTAPSSTPAPTALPTVAPTAAPTPVFLGYDVFVIMGQSNAVGYGLMNETTPINNSLIWAWNGQNDTVEQAFDPIPVGTPLIDTRRAIGFPTTTAVQHLPYLDAGRKVLLINCARGGTGFGDFTWTPSGVGTQWCMARVAAAMATAGTHHLLAVLWHQGEGDVYVIGSGMSVSTYAANLLALVQYVRANFSGANASTPWVVGHMSPAWITGVAERVALDNFLGNVSATVPFSAAINNTDASFTGLVGDNIHFDTSSLLRMGVMYYTQYRSVAFAGTTAAPTALPTVQPTSAPTASPTATPTAVPSAAPSASPTAAPSSAPTVSPTGAPTVSPTNTPTASPSSVPTASPTSTPTAQPTPAPSPAPTATPTAAPTAGPACATGSYAVNDTLCAPCAPGRFTAAPASTACLLCAVGRFSDHTNTTQCSNCTNGTYADTTGSTMCLLCVGNASADGTACMPPSTAAPTAEPTAEPTPAPTPVSDVERLSIGASLGIAFGLFGFVLVGCWAVKRWYYGQHDHYSSLRRSTSDGQELTGVVL